MLTPETTNANAEAQQMPGGRIKNWAKKNDQFLLGATTTGIGAAAGAAAFAALTRPPPNGIDPDIAAHVKENSVTIIVKAYDADDNVLTFTKPFTGEKTEIYGHGSGAFLEGTDGRLISTAAHVVQNPKLPKGAEELRYFVVPNGGKLAGQELEFKPPTTDTAVDTTNDVAIVDLGRKTGYTGAEFAPPGSAEYGETVYGIGTPLNPIHAGTLKKFTISSLDGHRVNKKEGGLEEQATEDLIQLDGILHQGNSGGILFDTDGRFLGVMTHRDLAFLDGVNESTIGFATRGEKVKELMERYMASPEYLQGGTSPTYQVYPDISGTTDTDADELRQHLENDDEFFDSIPTGSGSHWKGGTKGPGNGNRELSEKWIDDVDLSASVPTGVLPPPPDDGPAPFFKDIPDFIVQNGGFSPQSAAQAILQNSGIPPGTPNVDVDADGGILACILEALEL